MSGATTTEKSDAITPQQQQQLDSTFRTAEEVEDRMALAVERQISAAINTRVDNGGFYVVVNKPLPRVSVLDKFRKSGKYTITETHNIYVIEWGVPKSLTDTIRD